jgi:proteasome accessory factor B
VIGNFVIKRGPKGFETPENFDSKRIFETLSNSGAVIDVRRGKGASLRALASSTEPLGEWDLILVPILDMKSLAALVLWHGDDVYVQSPPELREIIIESLKDLAQAHG